MLREAESRVDEIDRAGAVSGERLAVETCERRIVRVSGERWWTGGCAGAQERARHSIIAVRVHDPAQWRSSHVDAGPRGESRAGARVPAHAEPRRPVHVAGRDHVSPTPEERIHA